MKEMSNKQIDLSFIGGSLSAYLMNQEGVLNQQILLSCYKN